MARSNVSFARMSGGTKVAVGVGVALLLAIAYFVIFYGDVSSAIASQTKQHANLVTERESARESQRVYTRDLSELNEREQRQRDLNKVLPESADYPSFLSAVQAVANVSGIGLASYSPLDEVRQQFFAKVPMKLTISGRFHQIAKFFAGVGQLDRIINIENISLTDPKLAGDDIQLTVQCLATAFHSLPLPGQAPAPGAPGGKP